MSKAWTMKNKAHFWSHPPKPQGSDRTLTPALFLKNRDVLVKMCVGCFTSPYFNLDLESRLALMTCRETEK